MSGFVIWRKYVILFVGKQIHKKGPAVTQLTCVLLNPDDALVILSCPDVHSAGCLSLKSLTAVGCKWLCLIVQRAF